MGIRKRRVRKPPTIVQLTPESVRCDRGIRRLFAEQERWSKNQVRILNAMFAFKGTERAFASRLLEEKPHLWVFRCNQQCFCGDFIVVDMSSPDHESRRVLAIELKERSRFKVGGGCFQLRKAAKAVCAIGRSIGIIAEDAPFETVVGSKHDLLAHLGLESEPTGGLGLGLGWSRPPSSAVAFAAEKC